jgi:CHAD domain-containing protein
VDMAGRPPIVEAGASPAADTLVPLARTRWRRAKRELSGLGNEPDDERLHRARIQIKRARYAAEAVKSVTGKRVRRFAKAAEDMQDLLGAHQDAVVAESWLRSHASGPRAAFAAGRLATTIRAESRVRHKDLVAGVKKLRARGKKAWS